MVMAGGKRSGPPSKAFLQVACDLAQPPEPGLVREMERFFGALFPSAEAEAAVASDKEEVAALFAPRGADPAGLELPIAEAWRLLHAMDLKEGDVFVDLGCSLGRVAFLASLMAGCKSRGVEMSPRRVAVGCSAAGRLPCALAAISDEAGSAIGSWRTAQLQRHVTIEEGDISDADLSEATFVFIGVRCSDPALMAKIVNNVTSNICRYRPGVITRLLAPAVDIQSREARLVRAFTIDGYGGELRVFAEYEVCDPSPMQCTDKG